VSLLLERTRRGPPAPASHTLRLLPRESLVARDSKLCPSVAALPGQV
jgi:hypothetical protein